MERKPPAPRDDIAAIDAAVHGALDFAELEGLHIAPDDVLDFSVNSNPFGPSPAVAAALAQTPLDRYPDRESLALRRALAAHLAVGVEQIVIGNGTAELIQLTAHAFLRGDDHVFILGPTFGEYARACSLMGARVHTWQADPADAFVVDVEAVGYLLLTTRPRLAFLCRPNNPTGTVLPLAAVRAWADAAPETLFVVDEAYLAFAAGVESSLTLGLPNMVSLHSMTKDYALAGLRLGYAVGHRDTISALARVRPAWNVNALAQAAGLAALEDQAHLQRTLRQLRRATDLLVSGFSLIGLPPCPSAVHFFLVEVGDAREFRRKLLRRGILVRDCTSFGLPAHVRIAARQPDDNLRLVRAVSEVLS
jgi:histidinol-phosphate aminotransferase